MLQFANDLHFKINKMFLSESFEVRKKITENRIVIEFQKQNSEKENKITCCLGIHIYVVVSKKKSREW